MDLHTCDKIIKKLFGLINFRTLSNIKNVERVNFLEEIPYREAYILLNKIFGSSKIYMRITFWNKSEYVEQMYKKYLIDYIEKKSSIEILLYLDVKSSIIYEILVKHLNFELALEPSINITCFFFSIENKKILNIYDDRGADYLDGI